MYVCIYSSCIMTFNSIPTHQEDTLFFISFYTYISYWWLATTHTMRKYKSTQDTLTHTYRHTHTNTVLSLRNHGNHKIRTCNAKIQIQTRQQRCSCDEKPAKGRLCVPQTSSLGGDKEKAERGSGRGGGGRQAQNGCAPRGAAQWQLVAGKSERPRQADQVRGAW